MKIFDFNAVQSEGFKITEGDRQWVEENFRWLKNAFGYPNRLEEQVTLTPKFFPATFSTDHLSVVNVLDDLCTLFAVPRHTVKHQLLDDIRDYNIPYQIDGAAFECETELKKGDYKIFIASSLLQHPNRLIYSLIYEFIRIRMTESELEFDVGGDDTGLFIYLAGIYYGFGIILSQNLIHQGRSTDGTYEIKWNYGSQMPEPVMAFSLAVYASLRGEEDPSWKNEFKNDFRKLFENAIQYVRQHPTDLCEPMEIKANDLFNEANGYFENNQLENAIGTLQKILFITNDDLMKADVFNNMGYYYLRTGDYKQAISNFRKALSFLPDYGFANDNLGYALIVTGELEEGRVYLQKAIDGGNSDLAYTFRNFAMYHWKRNDLDLAESFFQKSFGIHTPVDLLEFHYGEFLQEKNQLEKARLYFQKSADKKEEEGRRKLAELAHLP